MRNLKKWLRWVLVVVLVVVGLARSDMASFVDSLVAPLSLINAFIVTTAIRKKETVGENLRRLEEIWDQYGVYEKVDDKQREYEQQL